MWNVSRRFYRNGCVSLWIVGAFAGFSSFSPAHPAEGAGFDSPNPLRSDRYLSTEQLAGPNFNVAPAATTDGFANTYTITSRFGTWPARGRAGVTMRIREIQALAQLEEVSKSDVFIDAVKNSATAPLKLVQAVATNRSRR